MIKKEKLARRFYETVELFEDGTFQVHLDHRPLKTPGGRTLIARSPALARELVAEWAAQEEFIDPEVMPLTGLANATIDRIAPRRTKVIEQLLPFFDTDTLRYATNESEEFAERSDQHWAPLRSWFHDTYGLAVPVITGFDAPSVGRESLAVIAERLAGIDDYVLTGFHKVVNDAGSIILGLALLDGQIDGEAVYELCHLEALYQAQKWGQDSEASARRARIKRDILAAECFIRLSLKA